MIVSRSALIGVWISLIAVCSAPAPASADPGAAAPAKNPVLILPGFLMPEFSYDPLRRALLRAGYTDVTVLQGWPWFASIQTYAARARQEADRARARTGARKVDLVCHSMGGLVGRYLIQRLGYQARVQHYVSFGTPHHGTQLGRAASWYARSAEQMQPGSRFLKRLNAEDRPEGIRFVAMQADFDEIVWPQTSAVLPGARNARIPDTLHVGGVLTDQFIEATIEALAR